MPPADLPGRPGPSGLSGRPPFDAEGAVRNAHAWFEVNSGWAPPDDDTLAEWVADGVCRCPDDCLATPDGWCVHGLASWALILADLAVGDARDAHSTRDARRARDGRDARGTPRPRPVARHLPGNRAGTSANASEAPDPLGSSAARRGPG